MLRARTLTCRQFLEYFLLYLYLFISVLTPLDIKGSENLETGQPFAFDLPQLFSGMYKNQLNSPTAVLGLS